MSRVFAAMLWPILPSLPGAINGSFILLKRIREMRGRVSVLLNGPSRTTVIDLQVICGFIALTGKDILPH